MLFSPFSRLITLLHEYGHYKHLKNIVCKELNISCDKIDIGIRKKNILLFEGKTFNSAYGRLNSSHDKYIRDNAKAGSKFVCQIVTCVFAFLSVVSILFSIPLFIIWVSCGVCLVIIEYIVYTGSSDKRYAKGEIAFKYQSNDRCKYNEFFN